MSPRFAVFVQILLLTLSIVAIAWGVALDYTVAFPGPSGEWANLAPLLACIVNIPVGILSLIVGLRVKNGKSSLRRLCIISSIIVLSLPLIGMGVERFLTR